MLPDSRKFVTPDQFLEMAFALGFLRKHERPGVLVDRALISISDSMLDRLAQAYHEYVRLAGLTDHFTYYRLRQFSGKNARVRLYNLEHRGQLRFIYEPHSQPPKVDRVAVQLSHPQAEEIVGDEEQRGWLERSLSNVSELA